jgi:hypothetical protein
VSELIEGSAMDWIVEILEDETMSGRERFEIVSHIYVESSQDERDQLEPLLERARDLIDDG